ncbi:hypothetical protein ACLBWP_15855 [Microbacterium sp. M1A1_1b]|uniref:hypothetical protein n=1 Tax=Curtobacterium sp. VKM Ac-2922 TaxID=2929475 RepID=UPI001FB5136E|nr:hypothetical protein [Curtobacterium sp. VKM Ac-2922]MCJ1715953.1 hypothetical protein [Curtobacterium sp. VKM Ac-2922]
MIDRPERADHPAIARLRVELDAAWKSMRTLAEVDDDLRARIIAELRGAVPDMAGRAAHEAGHQAVVAEIRRFADIDVDATDAERPTCAIWGEIVDMASVAAMAAAHDPAPVTGARR